jgi:Mg-chelatase subunit ChlD
MKRVLLSLLLLCLIGCPPSPQQMPGGANLNLNQTVATLESGTAVAVVLDTSGSMDGQRLETVKQVALNNIAPKLHHYAIGKGLDLTMVECGGSSPAVHIRNTPYNHDQFTSVVNGLNAGGGTPLAESIHAAFVELAASKKEERHIFVLTDGEAMGVAEVLRDAKARGGQNVVVHLVGFQSQASRYADFQENGAHVMMAENPKDLDTTCDAIFKTILKVEAE